MQTETRAKILLEKRMIDGKPEKAAVVKIIGKSFKAWAGNLIILCPFIFLILVIFIGVLLVYPRIEKPASDSYNILVENLKGGRVADSFRIFFQDVLTLFKAISILLATLIYLIVLAFATSYFAAGSWGMANEIWQKKKTTLRTMHIYGKHFMLRYLGVKILIYLIIAGYFLIFSLPFIITRVPGWLVLPAITFLPGIFLFLMFGLSAAHLIIGDLTVKGAIKKSCLVLSKGKNYLSFLGLLFAFGTFCLIVFYIAFFIIPPGEIGAGVPITISIYLLIIFPVQALALTQFALNRKKYLISLT